MLRLRGSRFAVGCVRLPPCAGWQQASKLACKRPLLPACLPACAAIMQLHPGWVGTLQRRYLAALGCIWFNRTEVRQRGCWRPACLQGRLVPASPVGGSRTHASLPLARMPLPAAGAGPHARGAAHAGARAQPKCAGRGRLPLHATCSARRSHLAAWRRSACARSTPLLSSQGWFNPRAPRPPCTHRLHAAAHLPGGHVREQRVLRHVQARRLRPG